jgi:hypothetical protein
MHKEAQDAGASPPASGSPATPRVSGEVVKGSVTEAPTLVETPAPSSSVTNTQGADATEGIPSEPSDTLLSAGKPAARLELILEDGLSQIEARLRDLDTRLAALEQKKPSPVTEPRHKPWLWLVFLIALVVVFQMFQRIR